MQLHWHHKKYFVWEQVLHKQKLVFASFLRRMAFAWGLQQHWNRQCVPQGAEQFPASDRRPMQPCDSERLVAIADAAAVRQWKQKLFLVLVQIG